MASCRLRTSSEGFTRRLSLAAPQRRNGQSPGLPLRPTLRVGGTLRASRTALPANRGHTAGEPKCPSCQWGTYCGRADVRFPRARRTPLCVPSRRQGDPSPSRPREKTAPSLAMPPTPPAPATSDSTPGAPEIAAAHRSSGEKLPPPGSTLLRRFQSGPALGFTARSASGVPNGQRTKRLSAMTMSSVADPGRNPPIS